MADFQAKGKLALHEEKALLKFNHISCVHGLLLKGDRNAAG